VREREREKRGAVLRRTRSFDLLVDRGLAQIHNLALVFKNGHHDVGHLLGRCGIEDDAKSLDDRHVAIVQHLSPGNDHDGVCVRVSGSNHTSARVLRELFSVRYLSKRFVQGVKIVVVIVVRRIGGARRRGLGSRRDARDLAAYRRHDLVREQLHVLLRKETLLLVGISEPPAVGILRDHRDHVATLERKILASDLLERVIVHALCAFACKQASERASE